jgi:hypothetical protein
MYFIIASDEILKKCHKYLKRLKNLAPPTNTNRPPQGQGFHRYNPWIEFIKANRGRFSTLSELSREYHRKR